MTMTPYRAAALAGLNVLCAAGAALAQTPPITTVQLPQVTVKGKQAEPVSSVTVVGERPTNRIDRQVYDVKSDISSSNGTAADALNNVPSVAVDPDGSVTLRGSSNVQILVDGKPSAMMQGDNRAATLNSLTADDIDSIEVINNPGAQFGNEAGGGPILNLVMRRNRAPGGFATLNANGGTAGRYNSALSGSYNEGPWGFQGGLNVRHDGRNSTGETVRDRIDPVTGAVAHSSQTSASNGLNDSVGGHGAVSYNLGTHDTLSANLAFNLRSNDQQSTDRYLNLGEAPGMPVSSDYLRTTRRDGDSKNYSWGARFDHKGELPGETLKIDLRVSGADNSANSAYNNVYAVASRGERDSLSHQRSDTDNTIIDFTGDYERPLGPGVVKLGYKAAKNKNSFDTYYTDTDPLSLLETVNTMRSNRFETDETNLALYGSYQLRLNERWGALAGLRTEYTDLDLNQVTTSIHAKNSYINYIPSLFFTYKLSEESNLRFSYAHRLRRPGANDLNPFIQYRDELNLSSGNPKLKPTQTDSFEIGYETRMAGLETNLRAYYRKDDDAILDRKYFISDTVALTTRENGPGTKAGGLEFTVNGKLLPNLTLNTSGNLARSEQRILDAVGSDNKRTASSLSGRLRLNYQPTKDDQLQLAVQARGKTLSGQGYREPNTTTNISLRHAFTPAVSLVFNVTDVFNSNKMETIVDTSTLKETTLRRFDGRVVYLGLSLRLGGATAAARRENTGQQDQQPGQRGPGGPRAPGGQGRPGGAPDGGAE